MVAKMVLAGNAINPSDRRSPRFAKLHGAATPMTIYEIPATTIDGKPQTLEPYRGKVLLIVNIASRCVFTSQYAGLEELYQKYRDRGLMILGFPCDQFGHQEPGTEAEIQSFCSLTYNVTFPLFAKINVNGDDAHPLYQFLKSAKSGFFGTRSIKWNFTKFLVNRHGEVVKRFGSSTTPSELEADIVALLE
jgi:glutathione peroxidase